MLGAGTLRILAKSHDHIDFDWYVAVISQWEEASSLSLLPCYARVSVECDRLVHLPIVQVCIALCISSYSARMYIVIWITRNFKPGHKSAINAGRHRC